MILRKFWDSKEFKGFKEFKGILRQFYGYLRILRDFKVFFRDFDGFKGILWKL